MHVLACQRCGAALPAPDSYGNSWCGYCRVGHHAPPHPPRPPHLAEQILAAAMIEQMTEDAARIPMHDDAVAAFLRQQFVGADAMYVAPCVAPKKEYGARRIHAAHLPPGERILALYDDTVFGSGEDGFVVTSRRVCWKNVADRAHAIEWAHLDPDGMYPDGRRLVLGAGAIEISGDEELMEIAADAFYVLAISARTEHVHAAPTTPPPPHTISYHAYAAHASSQAPPAYSCWQCATPVYWNTPQCARCGAWPTAHGWVRTA